MPYLFETVFGCYSCITLTGNAEFLSVNWLCLQDKRSVMNGGVDPLGEVHFVGRQRCKPRRLSTILSGCIEVDPKWLREHACVDTHIPQQAYARMHAHTMASTHNTRICMYAVALKLIHINACECRHVYARANFIARAGTFLCSMCWLGQGNRNRGVLVCR